MGKKSNWRRDKAKAAQAKAEKPKVEVVNGRTRTITRNPPPEGLNPYLNWYLVYTAPRAEAKAKHTSTAIFDVSSQGDYYVVPLSVSKALSRKRSCSHVVRLTPRLISG